MDRFGISTALLTPFTETGEIDCALLANHACDVLANGADSVTLFGTTGEGASISNSERHVGIEALLTAGCSPVNIVLGVCATSIGDAVEQINTGHRLKIRDFLLLPPFYFKDCSDKGLLEWHREVFARTASDTRFILYHLPQVSGVGLSLGLVADLATMAPTRIRAIKDSSGDWENTKALLSQKTIQVLVGDERLLHRAVSRGASGAISGMANLYPARKKLIFQTATQDEPLSEEVSRIVSVPVIAALKTIHSTRTGEAGWERLRPPLTKLSTKCRNTVLGTVSQVKQQ